MSASHGNTPAAWIAVAVGLLGFLIGSVAMMLDPISWLVFWVGVAVTVAGGLLFIVLSKLGFNVESH
ncbi:HGxxPAAW family protein [Nocardioides sp. NPDC127514]|jgi:peptidoglycan/LPS O-acetylase OafA/YrhL|uniref:HGxxPAAW family protein n=1 Tax=unclassified Nocardioides TaxID=2615069 RepID=UPI001356A954